MSKERVSWEVVNGQIHNHGDYNLHYTLYLKNQMLWTDNYPCHPATAVELPSS